MLSLSNRIVSWIAMMGLGVVSIQKARADFIQSYAGLRGQAVHAAETGDLDQAKRSLFEMVARQPDSVESLGAVEDLKKLLMGHDFQKNQQEYSRENGLGFSKVTERSLKLDRMLIQDLADPEKLSRHLAQIMKRGGIEAGEATLLAVLAGATGQMGFASYLFSKTDRIILEIDSGDRPVMHYTRNLRPLDFRMPEIFSRYSTLSYRAESLDVIPFIEPQRGIGLPSQSILNAALGLRYLESPIKGVVQGAQVRAEVFTRMDRSLRAGLSLSSTFQQTPNEAFSGVFPWTHYLQGQASYINFKDQEYKLEISTHLSNRKTNALEESRRSFGLLAATANDFSRKIRVSPYLGTRNHFDSVNTKSGRRLEAGFEGAGLASVTRVTPILNYDYGLSPSMGPSHRFSSGALIGLNSWAKMRFYPEWNRSAGQTEKSLNLKLGTLHLNDLLSTVTRVTYSLSTSLWQTQFCLSYDLRN